MSTTIQEDKGRLIPIADERVGVQVIKTEIS